MPVESDYEKLKLVLGMYAFVRFFMLFFQKIHLCCILYKKKVFKWPLIVV